MKIKKMLRVKGIKIRVAKRERKQILRQKSKVMI
jgi:hypothetical protein